MFFPLQGIKDIPPSGVTKPICGIMGTIRLVAGRFSVIMMFRYFHRIRNVDCMAYIYLITMTHVFVLFFRFCRDVPHSHHP